MKFENEEWNKFVLANGGSFLQSWEWGEFQQKLGTKVLRIAGDGFQSLLIKRPLPLGKNYLYAPHGPVLKERDISIVEKFAESAKKTARDERAFFLRIDLNLQENESRAVFLKNMGFKKTYENQPQKTIILDLNKSENNLLQDMDAETRYAIRTAEKRGVEVLSFDDVEEKNRYFEDFWQMFQETMTRGNLKSYSKDYFRELFRLNGDVSTKLFLAKAEENIIASAVFLFFGDTAVYLYAASQKGFGKFNAPSFIIWKAILDAQKRGCRFFDLWGISYQKKKWAGITAFKKSFGGKEVGYAGAWDLPLDKFWYFLYKVYKRFFQKER